jgi:ABC-type branched-subunit amino acid transport system substrate-binding protein
MKQQEMTQTCRTCGTKNSAYEPYCKVCQSVLEGTATLQSIDRKTYYSTFFKHLPILRPPTIAHLKEQPLWIVIPVVLVISTVLATLIPHLFAPPSSTQPTHRASNTATLTANKIGKDGIGVTEVNKESIGISDGRFVLDPNRADGADKLQAATDLRNGNIGAAMAAWTSALAVESDDAEPLIYLEDQRVLASGSPFITFVVNITFSNIQPDGRSRGILQGAYIAQKENNDNPQLYGGIKIRLLIATTGSDPKRSVDIAQQTIQAARADKTIVGILSGATSDASLDTVQTYTQAHMPMVGSIAAADELTNLSPYYFRVTPPNNMQASLLTTYIEHKLQPKRLVLFVDKNEPFSRDLANSFSQKYTSDGYSNFSTQNFTSGGNAQALTQRVQDVLNTYHPDVIVFTSIIVDDYATLLNAIPSTQQFAGLKVVGGVPTYELIEGGKPFTGYTRLRFVSPGFPDEWMLYRKQPPPFFADYAQAFDPQRNHTGSPYGYTRPTVFTMLAYDAAKTLLAGSQLALQGGKQTFTPEELRRALAQLNGPRTVPGITGNISLGPDGNPTNKADLVLRVDDHGDLQMDAVQGCFDAINCTNQVTFLH